MSTIDQDDAIQHQHQNMNDTIIQPDFFTRLDENNTSTLDPSLFALAAQVQAVAHAHEQGIDINFNIDHTFIDPIFPDGTDFSNLGLNNNTFEGFGINGHGQPTPIDPILFEIAQVVEDVNKGKIKLDLQPSPPQPHPTTINNNVEQIQQNSVQLQSSGHQQGHAQDGNVDVNLDVEIDPTLREIVNSLTNAQQSSQVNGQGLSQAQASAAIGAHLTDAEERERLQRSLQTTLEDLTQASFNSLFPATEPNSSNGNFMNAGTESSLISEPSSSQHPGTYLNSTAGPHPNGVQVSSTLEEYASKRGRGRPKGSKNKHKAVPLPKPPKPPGPAPKPKGRPPKERNPEEQADYELRRHERSLGIKRQKGRPRKFPGYLVREMRLKKNRKEFNELLRTYERNTSATEDDDEDDDDEDDNNIHHQQLDISQNHYGDQNEDMAKVQEQMRLIMNADVENMTNGLHHALQVNNTGNGVDQAQHQHQHHHEENDFSQWNIQDGQSLLDVVGMGTGHGGVGDHTMEGVFGLNHQMN
ncbi:uncharacterized protein I206_104049 [Kwoniella pini CBS 10737]|uniref:Uncharacterized protein n=1 Tax=Kwoniella pini CBS 10737 TaxID=1296096 RepID=A0A1B9I305_9TREE|nr:uncharacterized protein I206_04375 [Kwoniella pini CBS 10737]OCF49848.1 hypothetical protein I206_04375 [Kwoniella pini CBS 10737]